MELKSDWFFYPPLYNTVLIQFSWTKQDSIGLKRESKTCKELDLIMKSAGIKGDNYCLFTFRWDFSLRSGHLQICQRDWPASVNHVVQCCMGAALIYCEQSWWRCWKGTLLVPPNVIQTIDIGDFPTLITIDLSLHF